MDYNFLSLEEFAVLEKSGELLESGIFDGRYSNAVLVSMCVFSIMMPSPAQ